MRLARDPAIDRLRTTLRFSALALLLALVAALAVAVSRGYTAMQVDHAIWCEPNTVCPTPAPPALPSTPIWRTP